MNVIYNRQDAEKWAAFSGDYNPIHFDPVHARRLGIENLSVHGMRALLDMKCCLSSAMLQNMPVAEFFSFSARMRHPVLCQSAYQMLLTGQRRDVEKSDVPFAVSGQLQSLATEDACFSGKLAVAGKLELGAVTADNMISTKQLLALGQQYPLPIIGADQQWGFLDALLFKCIVDAPETMVTVKTLLPALQANTLNEIFGQIPVVQTHHDVHFCARLFTPHATAHIVDALHYAIQPTLIIGKPESGFVIRTAIQAWSEDRPLMATAVTLKTRPMAI